MPENCRRTRQLPTCDASADVALDAKYRRTADAVLKMIPRDDVAAGRRRLRTRQSAVRRKHYLVDNAASPDWQTPLNGIISPSERG